MRNQVTQKGDQKPHYRHGCPYCQFLGSYVHERDGVHDLYYCRGFLVAVRSDDPELTFGVPASAFIAAGLDRYHSAFPSLSHARRLARQKGLI